MKQNILAVLLISWLAFSCSKTNNNTTDCDTKPQWLGYDEECGCFGIPIGFQKKCITSFQEGDIPYFGLANYGHIKDSILIILKSDKESISIKSISEIPSLDSKSSDIQFYLEQNKSIPFIYDDTFWNNPNALGKATELRVDPKLVLQEKESFEVNLYQRKSASLASQILDSLQITVVKDLDRK